ncbi:hypothetical protein KM915_20820 [Cytobacillus oceanisediminis]|uniref:hypothetical protein n=1 Tax=Cytobacillus oceanisediminis TaxID=665099 RepID=UPI001C22FC7E|nr:hypothetical protein [Cytobacillus oceanisediminis]MBU8732494.1 hypothetical protein [Cytobacillus oceanisediminis]
MSNILSFILLLPFIIWSTFQPILFINASMVQETLQLATYEGQKEASLKGKYDEEIYKKIRDYLVEVHHYDPDKIQISGTETETPRGGKIFIEITVPKPMLSVIDVFSIDNTQPYKVKKYIVSEYIPE